MCLLSVYSPGALVNADHLEAGAWNNPDGYGFAIISGDRIETGHGMDSGAVIHAFATVRDAHPESWALFHSRFTTDGLTSEDNCHPFVVGGDRRTILAHNGILPRSARPKKGDNRSDTRILAESLIPNGHFGQLHRPRARRALESWIASEGYPNKVAILTVDRRYRGNAFILGEGHGTWVDGVWHSNYDYVPYEPMHRSTVHGTFDPFGDYMAGKISYSQYIDLKYGISKAVVFECSVCLTAENVDQVYMYCRTCRTCLDCFDNIDSCNCFIPASQRSTKNGSGLTGAAIESALTGLPQQQANQVRDALRDMP